ncbi:MAG: DUF72 domain-containing protein [Acidiferrobacterales bacterium]
MTLYAGTSGYSYKEWKGNFYPNDLPAPKMLGYYASKLPAVEINNTFYRLPKASVLESWAVQVPQDFRFALKASRRITHIKRLKDAAEETDYLLQTTQALKGALGVVLFQLPPYLRKDLPRLDQFLDGLPENTRAAFEFRHPSWFDDEVFERLRARNLALCVTDTDDDSDETSIVSTARWGYLRLRRADYVPDHLGEWVERVRAQDWEDVYVFFKHEDEGAGPKLAARFLELANASSTPFPSP